MNSIGTLFRLTTFGESHGPAIGGVIDGMPPRFPLDLDQVQRQLDRRAPGRSPLSSQRREADCVEFLSGLFEGLTLGTPIGFIIRNGDSRPQDYEPLRHVYRPNHADFTYQAKYGIRDHRGGGRASARETACRVVAGAVARQVLQARGIEITAGLPPGWERKIEQARSRGDSVGGVVSCTVTGVPAGVGEPLYDKLSARLAGAMMSINAARAFEIGDGWQMASGMWGSECLDPFDGTANHSGGIQGGISNGRPIEMRIAFRPTPTIMLPVATVTDTGIPTVLRARGRHDPCVALRAIPVVEAMAAMTILDLMMMGGGR